MAHGIPAAAAAAFKQRMAQRLDARRGRAGAPLSAAAAGRRHRAAAPQLRADHGPVADVATRAGRARRLPCGAAGRAHRSRQPFPVELDHALRALWQGTLGRRPSTTPPGDRRSCCARSPSSSARRASLLGGCPKHEPPPVVVRPVQLVQVKAGSAETAAVFAGEVKPRHEADLAFRIGGKIVARSVDIGARVRKGQVLARLDPADVGLQAEAAQGRGRGRRGRAHLRQGRVRALPEPLPREIRQRERAGAEAQRCSTRPAPGSTRRARSSSVTQNQAAYAALVAPDSGVITAVAAEAGQVVGAGQTVLKLAREDEPEVAISVPENRLRRARACAGDRRLPVGESAEDLSGAGARDRAGGRSGDPHVRRAGVDPAAPTRRCNGG